MTPIRKTPSAEFLIACTLGYSVIYTKFLETLNTFKKKVIVNNWRPLLSGGTVLNVLKKNNLQFTAKNVLRPKNKDRMLILFLCPHLTDGCLISADELTIWPKVVNRIMALNSHNYSAKLLLFYLCLKYRHLSASMAGI